MTILMSISLLSIGAIIGFVIAVFVAMSTLSSPVGPILSTALVGMGAIMGSRIGTSAHETPGT